jgi:hypothetical protein
MDGAIKTDGDNPLQWKWLLHVVYEDHYEVAYGAAWCPGSSASCAMTVLETMDEMPHESAMVFVWNTKTHQRAAMPIVPRNAVNVPAV